MSGDIVLTLETVLPYTQDMNTSTDTAPRIERCCATPDIEAISGMGNGENNIITITCLACDTDLLTVWPQGSLHEDGWPKDWSR